MGKSKGKIILINGSMGAVRTELPSGAMDYQFEADKTTMRMAVGSPVSFDLEGSFDEPMAVNLQLLAEQ